MIEEQKMMEKYKMIEEQKIVDEQKIGNGGGRSSLDVSEGVTSAHVMKNLQLTGRG